MTSSSSGMSSTDDRWYDLTETLESGTTATSNGGGSNNSPPPIPARNSNTATSIIVNQQQSTPLRSVATSIMKTNERNGSTPNSNNNALRGNGDPRSMLNGNNSNNNNQTFQQQNGTTASVLVVNKHANNVNGNHNNGIYMTSPAGAPGTMGGGTPVEKGFVAKRDFFQRNNPHHGSFHTKLSPSRSHDLLHLKSTYGIHHSQLRPFQHTNSATYDDYGAMTVAANGATRFHDGRLYDHVMKSGATYNSPLIENTVKAKMTYLTDFPLNHSHSSEYLVSYGLNDLSPQKDLDALKNQRLAQLKSTYLEKHRERFDRDNESQKSRFSAPADSISGEINRSEGNLHDKAFIFFCIELAASLNGICYFR